METQPKTFNLYCDESTHLIHDGHPYMLLAYVSINALQIRLAKKQIRNICEKHKFYGEIKWTNVHEATFPMYRELVQYFFMTDMRFRAIIVDKSQIDETRPDYTFNDFYYRMYFQLLHNQTDMECSYNVFLDIKDTCSSGKLKNLHEILKYNTSIERLQFVRSHESLFIQMADFIMGAVNYNLRMQTGNVDGKVQAKLKIIDEIKKHGEITRTTPLSNKKFNLFFIKLQ